MGFSYNVEIIIIFWSGKASPFVCPFVFSCVLLHELLFSQPAIRFWTRGWMLSNSTRLGWHLAGPYYGWASLTIGDGKGLNFSLSRVFVEWRKDGACPFLQLSSFAGLLSLLFFLSLKWRVREENMNKCSKWERKYD
jgi:hypothetical protein